MKVKMTVGEVGKYMNKAVEYSRLKMTYASNIDKVRKNDSFFSGTKIVNYPIEDTYEYWQYMSGFYPWTELVGFWSVVSNLPEDREVMVSCEAAGQMIVLHNLYNKKIEHLDSTLNII